MNYKDYFSFNKKGGDKMSEKLYRFNGTATYETTANVKARILTVHHNKIKFNDAVEEGLKLWIKKTDESIETLAKEEKKKNGKKSK
jgi:hypothetical protein